MTVIEHQFRTLREQAESLTSNGLTEVDVRQAVAVALSLWETAKAELSQTSAESRQSRPVARAIMSMLRAAELLIGSTLDLVAEAERRGVAAPASRRLVAAQHDVRRELLTPMATLMARQDPEGRRAEELRDILFSRVQFLEGRPVITEAVTVGLPNPLEPETNL